MKNSIEQFSHENFEDLKKKEKKDLLKLISMISESSYRRGFQQGSEILEDERTINPETLRFSWSISKSPDISGGCGMSSIDRVLTEFPQLEIMGFCNL